jgi:hypothetical protein
MYALTAATVPTDRTVIQVAHIQPVVCAFTNTIAIQPVKTSAKHLIRAMEMRAV